MAESPTSPADATLAALVDALDEAALVSDDQLRCRSVGRRLGEIFGLDPRLLIGVPRAEVLARLAQGCDAPEAILGPLADAALSAEATVVDPIELSRPTPRTLVWTSVPVRVAGRAAGRIDVVRDVSRERQAERASEELAKFLEEVSPVDPLTGLANRRRFEQESDREHRRAQRAWDSYAIARIDVDGMRTVNETHGTAHGDELLRAVGEELRKARREYDVVARWGEDEFIVLLPGASAAATRTVLHRSVRGIADKLFDIAGRPPPPGSMPPPPLQRGSVPPPSPDFAGPGPAIRLKVTVSAGGAVWIPPSGESAMDVIRRAGAALAAARLKAPSAIEVDAGFSAWKDDLDGG